MSLRIQLMKDLNQKDVVEALPQLRTVRQINMLEEAFHRNLLEAMSLFRASLRPFKKECQEQFQTAERVFTTLNKKIDTTINKINEKREKNDDEKQSNERNEEEQNHENLKLLKHKNKKSKKMSQGDLEELDSKIKLKKRQRIQQISYKSNQQAFFCSLCLRKFDILTRQTISKSFFSKKQDYLQHLSLEHQTVPYLYLQRQLFWRFSHVLFKGEFIRVYHRNAYHYAKILCKIMEGDYSSLFVCGCDSVVIKSLKSEETQCSIQIDEESFEKHVRSVHKGRNQKNSSHFLASNTEFSRVEKHLDIDEQFYLGLQQKICQQYRKKFFFLLNYIKRQTNKQKYQKLQKDITKIQLFARLPINMKNEVYQKILEKIPFCTHCHNYFQDLQLKKNHELSCEGQKYLNACIGLNKNDSNVETWVKERYIHSKRHHYFTQVKNNPKIFLNLEETLLPEIYKCGHCHGDQGFFFVRQSYLLHLQKEHDTLSEFNSHEILSYKLN